MLKHLETGEVHFTVILSLFLLNICVLEAQKCKICPGLIDSFCGTIVPCGSAQYTNPWNISPMYGYPNNIVSSVPPYTNPWNNSPTYGYPNNIVSSVLGGVANLIGKRNYGLTCFYRCRSAVEIKDNSVTVTAKIFDRHQYKCILVPTYVVKIKGNCRAQQLGNMKSSPISRAKTTTVAAISPVNFGKINGAATFTFPPLPTKPPRGR